MYEKECVLVPIVCWKRTAQETFCPFAWQLREPHIQGVRTQNARPEISIPNDAGRVISRVGGALQLGHPTSKSGAVGLTACEASENLAEGERPPRVRATDTAGSREHQER